MRLPFFKDLRPGDLVVESGIGYLVLGIKLMTAPDLFDYYEVQYLTTFGERNKIYIITYSPDYAMGTKLEVWRQEQSCHGA